MKAVISNRIYMPASAELMESLAKQLTYRIYTAQSKIKGGPDIVRTFQRINANMLSVPAGRQDLIPAHYEIVDKRILVPIEDFPKFKFELRDSQQAVYDGVNDFAIVNAPVSWGKTFCGIAIASKLKQKTLVVTHTTMLRDQWVQEIEKCLDITPGIIGSGSFDLDAPIVVANIQTLAKNVDTVAELFGTLILDEAHHCPASTFSGVIDKCKARYKIGLTGTLERKDGKHVLFKDYFGPVLFRPKAENYMVPEVVIVKTGIMLPGSTSWANKVTELEVFNEKYQQLVIELADSAANQGHKVLVVGGRVEFLERAAKLTKNKAVSITGNITSLEERQNILASMANEAKILFGTCSIFAEGISQNDLSCLILATPINNNPLLTQLIGRIVRLKEGKKTPLVIDLNLTGATGRSQANARLGHYIGKGYKVSTLDKSS